MRVAIIGSNLTGLALAHLLHKENYDGFSIYILDERAEIGFPCLGSGLLVNSNKWLEILNTWLISPTYTSKFNQSIGLSFRRDWLEKDLALSLVSKGIKIDVRTTVVNKSETTLSLVGVGGKSTTWEGDLVIDCTRESTSIPIGAISQSPQSKGWQRSDGTWEGWYAQLPTEFTILQILNANSSSTEENTIDFSLELAKNKFEKIYNTYLDR